MRYVVRAATMLGTVGSSQAGNVILFPLDSREQTFSSSSCWYLLSSACLSRSEFESSARSFFPRPAFYFLSGLLPGSVHLASSFDLVRYGNKKMNLADCSTDDDTLMLFCVRTYVLWIGGHEPKASFHLLGAKFVPRLIGRFDSLFRIALHRPWERVLIQFHSRRSVAMFRTPRWFLTQSPPHRGL